MYVLGMYSNDVIHSLNTGSIQQWPLAPPTFGRVPHGGLGLLHGLQHLLLSSSHGGGGGCRPNAEATQWRLTRTIAKQTLG